jgi:sortase A
VVGGIGKVLIVVGLLMFAFVAYQLWGTGIYTAQAQHRLDDEFAQLASSTTIATPSSAPVTSVSQPVPTTPATLGSTSPATAAPTSVASASGTNATTAPAPSPGTVAYPFGTPQQGKVLARLQIPQIGVDFKVVEGVGLDDLAEGPGHFPESVLPGQLGNTAIAGHRTTHGAPFYDVDHLGSGDQIVVSYPGGAHFVYLVTGTDIVAPSDYADVVPTTDPTKATLVLSSCHPIREASKRIIVRAELDPTLSSPLFAPTPLGEAAASTIPGDGSDAPAPTAAAETTTAATAAPVGTTSAPPVSAVAAAGPTLPAASGPGTPSTTAPPATTQSDPPTQTSTAPAASQDAFGGGWFDDGAAWPPIVLWGLALVAITTGGYRLARRHRRIWLGIVVAFAPFVFALYFWFENINRLLPPGL